MPNIISISGGGGTSSSWFTNIPDGNWVLKSTAKGDTFPGFSNNVIPLTANFSTDYRKSSSNCTSGSLSDNRTISVNGKRALYSYASMGFDISRGGADVHGTANADNVFLPFYYDFDLTAVQEGVTSGTISTWLVRE